jgi:UDP-N-acetylmuramoyl-L-alanyl-D-glutamate--2,6-diaminopimelate ligase
MFRKVVKALIPSELFKKIEPAGHRWEAKFWQMWYRHPARDLKIIGVTGTDGKTTTTMLIWQMLRTAGYNAGYMTTIGYGTPRWQKANYIHMTTVSTRLLLRRIIEMKRDGIDWLVLETTSHALAQNRVYGVPFSLGVLTYVGHEHLDYHGTFENYRDAKKQLFTLVGQNADGLGVGVINADDPSEELFAAEVRKPLRYGVKKGDIKAFDIVGLPHGSTYVVRRGKDALNVTTNLPGSFNVYNSLAAVSVGMALGLTNPQIEDGIASLNAVEGRMTLVEADQDFTVIVDFAHTPDSFRKLLSDIKSKMPEGKKLIVMFGSAGRRDEAKRSIQGEVAGTYADLVVVTEEDDRDIDGQQILDQIAEGAKSVGKVMGTNLFQVHDRSQAIKYAMELAQPGDTVMLLGKGHEKTIERADGEHPWDEVAEAKAAIAKVKELQQTPKK